MDIRINIKPDTAKQIICDLENKKVKLLPETEKFLMRILNKIDSRSISIRQELEEFEEINFMINNNGEENENNI